MTTPTDNLYVWEYSAERSAWIVRTHGYHPETIVYSLPGDRASHTAISVAESVCNAMNRARRAALSEAQGLAIGAADLSARVSELERRTESDSTLKEVEGLALECEKDHNDLRREVAAMILSAATRITELENAVMRLANRLSILESQTENRQ